MRYDKSAFITYKNASALNFRQTRSNEMYSEKDSSSQQRNIPNFARKMYNPDYSLKLDRFFALYFTANMKHRK